MGVSHNERSGFQTHSIRMEVQVYLLANGIIFGQNADGLPPMPFQRGHKVFAFMDEQRGAFFKSAGISNDHEITGADPELSQYQDTCRDEEHRKNF